MTKEYFIKYVGSVSSHVMFDYNGKYCLVDPISSDSIFISYDGNRMEAKSIDEVMHSPFFGGKSLDEIFDELDNFEW